ncbi:hypothetical protein HanRHA438_Chr17g0808791 [Helianthus annuus]|nr:hypothetical protein HanIR_Chr17g0866141 [Helianthus annuus]KAJ0825949.1 hypothetical protein HanRHA438_Chr17g0808791 [Helianthus annuus]
MLYWFFSLTFIYHLHFPPPTTITIRHPSQPSSTTTSHHSHLSPPLSTTDLHRRPTPN